VVVIVIGTIGLCYLIEILLVKPDVAAMARGLLPAKEILTNYSMLYIAVGMLGATVMPHNLYLHSSLVQTRAIERTPEGLQTAVRYNLLDSVLALNLAFLVNAAILVMAAATFYRHGLHHVAEIQDAYHTLSPLLGVKAASLLFAVALLCSGQNSTITGTLAGQVVMEGFLHLRLTPWLRRLVTRLLAIIPAIFTVIFYGAKGTNQLLILSQVVLSLQLSFAVFPLVKFAGSKALMGKFATPRWLHAISWTVAWLIAGLNVYFVFTLIRGTIP
ncbi:MAG: divalent metal cation transporter, partial [Terriglobia bacterium]